MKKKTSPIKLTPWDAADYLNTPTRIAHYLEAALEDYDPKHVANVLGDVARSKGLAKVAKAAGVPSESLRRALTGVGASNFFAVLTIIQAVGLRVVAKPARNRVATKKPAKLAA